MSVKMLAASFEGIGRNEQGTGSGEHRASESTRRSIGKRLSWSTRIYVWSVVLEPLLFFVVLERTSAGLTGHLGRLLQALVVARLTLLAVTRLMRSGISGIRLPNPANPLYAAYSVYFALAALAGMLGLIHGAYDLPVSYRYDATESGISRLLNSEAIRPLVEYVIALYYFFYFAVLPRYVLRTENAVRYFFSVFKAFFVLSFAIGVVDLALSACGIFLVPRHIADWYSVGVRFHGLAGEPREAFVYLFLGLAVLHLHAQFTERPLSKRWIIAVIAAAALTQSASGLVGIAFFCLMYWVYSLARSLGRFSLRRVAWSCGFSVLVIGLLYAVATHSERVMNYAANASDLWNILENGRKVPYLLRVQADSIYPLYDLTVKFRHGDFLPILIGSGLGSTSVVNDIYDPSVAAINNPSSQFVRTIYESGLIGTGFFALSFVYPAQHVTRELSGKKQHAFVLMTLLLLGCFFGHRSAVSFIYLGILLATFRVLSVRPSPVPPTGGVAAEQVS